MALPNKKNNKQKDWQPFAIPAPLSRKGQPIDYEILVDGFKAVSQNKWPGHVHHVWKFCDSGYSCYWSAPLYRDKQQQRKRIFYFGDLPKDGLSGVDVKNIVDEEVQRKLRKGNMKPWKMKTKASTSIADLESEVENWRTKYADSKWNNLHWTVSWAMLVKFGWEPSSNAIQKLMSAFPGGEALAGLLQSNNDESSEEPIPDSEVSFKPKAVLPSNSSITRKIRLPSNLLINSSLNSVKRDSKGYCISCKLLPMIKVRLTWFLNHVNIKQS